MDSYNPVNMSEEDIDTLVAVKDYGDVDEPDINLQPAGRRWEPVGEAAANDENDTTSAQYDTES